jgi:hypothetical protein
MPPSFSKKHGLWGILTTILIKIVNKMTNFVSICHLNSILLLFYQFFNFFLFNRIQSWISFSQLEC